MQNPCSIGSAKSFCGAAMRLKAVLKAAFVLGIAAVPGLGQAAPGAAKPDFSGIWAHPWLPGFEALPSGPTALVNLSRTPEGRSIQTRLVGDDKNPILKPEAAETVRKFGDQSKSYIGFPNPRNQCWPNGLPFVLSANGQQIFDRGDHLTIIYRVDHQVRRVRMNQPHPARVIPSYFGDSVGRYDGDTLVIDTVGIKPGPFAMIDWFGTPQTPTLHIVERYRMLDYATAKDGLDRAAKENALPQPATIDLDYKGKHLQLTFTVEDHAVFTTPWSATVTYGRPVGEWLENVCAENPNKYGTERDAQVPTAAKPDF